MELLEWEDKLQIEQKDKFIIIFSRGKNNERNIERCEFSPFFYVGIDEDIPIDERIVNVEEWKNKTLYGERVKKVTVKNPYDIPHLRNLFYKTYEADIPFIWRYWIDRVKEVPLEILRKLYVDIETEDMPDTQLNNKPITCIGFFDNYTNIYHSILVNKSEIDVRVEQRSGHIIYYCPTEYSLLSKFIDLVHELDPDMLIAHNGDRFDFPVIVGRLMVLSVMGYGKMSPLGIVKRENLFGEWRTKVAGRILFDFLGTKTNYGIKGGIRGLLDGRDITVKDKDGEDRIVRIKRWSLAYLAQFVGMKKGEYEKVQCLEDMIKYNRQDVEIMVELDKFFNVTEYYHNMQTLIGCPYEATYFNTNMIDIFLLKRFPQFVFPTKPQREKGESLEPKIKGATVDDPVAGLYEKLYVIDQTSLYPTVVISSHMSPENVRADGDIKLGNGICFDSKNKGIIADAVEFLLEIRLKYKKMAKEEPDSHKAQMYGLISDGYKTLLVSFYGALLFKGFRLYDYKVAESIPYMGRVIKEHVRNICKNNGYDVVYGDTDSTFLVPNKYAVPIDTLVDIINKSFDEFSKNLGMPSHRFHIELDKVFSPIIVADVAKRYVGFLEKKGKKIFKSVGFEAVRRDTAKITEDIQETIFKMILNGNTKNDVVLYINSCKEDIKGGKYRLNELMLPKGFSKAFDKFKVDSPWVRAAEYSNKNLGTRFDQFSDLGIFYIKNVPEGKPYTDVVAIDSETEYIMKDFLIDWTTQIDKLIDHKVENIFRILKWEDTRQRTLGEF